MSNDLSETSKLRFVYVATIALLVELAGTALSAPSQKSYIASISSEVQTEHLSLPSFPELRPNVRDINSSQSYADKTDQDSLSNAPTPTTTVQVATGTTLCERPVELFSPADYKGPLEKVAAWIARRPELTTVPSRWRNGVRVCSLDVRQKFDLFTQTTIDPLSFVAAGVNAGISQGLDYDSEWGQGAEGYGKRYGAAYTDIAINNFFGKFFYPAIFRQDPRYYRLGGGPIRKRIKHALAHTFVARGDSGRRVPNFSLWATTASSIAMSNLYHPENDHGFLPGADRVGSSIGGAMGFDLLREFWPETVRKLRLPFRERPLVPESMPAKP